MSSEWHVSSLFVQTRPDATESVTQLLNAMANTEVAASEETTGETGGRDGSRQQRGIDRKN